VLLINGSARSTLDAADRGLLYGDGVFETMAVVEGRIPLWDRHLRRLAEGCRSLGFEPPDANLLRREADSLLTGKEACILKIIVTRGCGGEAYLPPKDPQPTRVVQTKPWPGYSEACWRKGICARYCHTRLATGSPVAGIKHLNRLEQVLARAEWRDPEVQEGLMLDAAGRVVEGTRTNLFVHVGERLITPPVQRCGVAGIMRKLVMEKARAAGFSLEEADLMPADIERADGIFVTNAVIGVWPVNQLDGRRYAPGKAVGRLQRILTPLIGSRP